MLPTLPVHLKKKQGMLYIIVLLITFLKDYIQKLLD